jgi:hypothetical protein
MTPPRMQQHTEREVRRGLDLGDSPLRRRLGRHRIGHLVLVLDVLEHRHILTR